MRFKEFLSTLAIFIFLVSCGGGDDGNTSSVGGGSTTDYNILDGSQATYTENNEEGNNARASAEPTGYILDSDGIELMGTLAENSTGSTGDQFLIYSGSSTSIDLQVFLNSEGLENNDPRVSTDFDALNDDGVSTLFSNSFRDISILSNTYYLIAIGLPLGNSTVLNQTYTIQIKGS